MSNTQEVYTVNIPVGDGRPPSFEYNPLELPHILIAIGSYGYALYVPDISARLTGAISCLVQTKWGLNKQPLHPTAPETLPVDGDLVARMVFSRDYVTRLYPYMVPGESRNGASNLGLDPTTGDFYLLHN